MQGNKGDLYSIWGRSVDSTPFPLHCGTGESDESHQHLWFWWWARHLGWVSIQQSFHCGGENTSVQSNRIASYGECDSYVTLTDTDHVTFPNCFPKGMAMVSRPRISCDFYLWTGDKPDLSRCSIPQRSQAVRSMRLHTRGHTHHTCTHRRAHTHTYTHAHMHTLTRTYVHTSKEIFRSYFSLGKKYIYITAMAHPG